MVTTYRELAALDEAGRRAWCEEHGWNFIGDGPPGPLPEGQDVRLIVERDGSVWLNAEELVGTLERLGLTAEWVDLIRNTLSLPK